MSPLSKDEIAITVCFVSHPQDYCNLLILTANEGTGHLERWKSLEYSRRQQRYRAKQKLLALCEIASVQAAAAALPPVTVVNDNDIKAK